MNPPRTRLEQILMTRNLGPTEFVREFGRRAADLGIDASTSPSALHRWITGNERPRVGSQKVLESWFSEPAAVLLGPPHSAPARESCSVEDMIVESGHSSAEHAYAAASAAIDPVAVEHLQAQVAHEARRFNTTPTLTMLQDLIALRNRVYSQIDRTSRPRQVTELYLIAGQVCGLISAASLDMGYADAAEEQARAVLTYGRYIESPSLEGWARALLATVAYWSGRPRHAAEHADHGLQVAAASSVRAQLHSLNARALGQLGAHDEVAQQLGAAVDQLDAGSSDPVFDEIGGELRFDRLRHAVCAASAHLALGDGARAEAASMEALEIASRGGEGRRLAVLAAHADLAAARTHNDDLAGAQSALAPVLELGTARRTERLTQRAVTLGRMLGVARYRGAAEATTLGLALEDFTQSSLPRALPPGVKASL